MDIIEPVSIGYGHAAVFAESPGSDLDAWRRLTTFVFISVHHGYYFFYYLRLISGSHNLRKGLIFFHIALQNSVQ